MAGHFKATGATALKMKLVGARGVVHTPQFNGKQESESALAQRCQTPAQDQPALPPQRSSEQTAHAVSPCPTQPLVALNKRLGRRTAVVFASPDTGQQGGRALVARPNVQALSGKAVRAFVGYSS